MNAFEKRYAMAHDIESYIRDIYDEGRYHVYCLRCSDYHESTCVSENRKDGSRLVVEFIAEGLSLPEPIIVAWRKRDDGSIATSSVVMDEIPESDENRIGMVSRLVDRLVFGSGDENSTIDDDGFMNVKDIESLFDDAKHALAHMNPQEPPHFEVHDSQPTSDGNHGGDVVIINSTFPEDCKVIPCDSPSRSKEVETEYRERISRPVNADMWRGLVLNAKYGLVSELNGRKSVLEREISALNTELAGYDGDKDK